MSNVVIINKNMTDQIVKSIEQSRVVLPFNVTKEQINKLMVLLSKIKATFLVSVDKLEIGNLSYNNLEIKNSTNKFENSRFTLRNTYVVTMRQNFIAKVKKFYNRILPPIENSIPVFDITKEVNLQEALQEATTEIDLNAINNSLNTTDELSQNKEVTQVLANSPLGNQILENSIDFNKVDNVILENNQAVGSSNAINNEVQLDNSTAVSNVNLGNQSVSQVVESNEEKGKVLVKNKRRMGSVLAVPIVIIWLGLILFGSIKLVTFILT